MKRYYFILPLLLIIFAVVACGSKSKQASADENEGKPKVQVQVSEFNADSAYEYVDRQVAYGPRVPNTAAHKACGNYLQQKLESFGAKVYVQEAQLTAYDGTLLHAKNVIGAYNPDVKKRILLLAHWDSRPWADADPDKANHNKPVPAANDGASGVGVLLEIARQLQQQAPTLGIDILFTDAEDWGPRQDDQTTNHEEEAWGLGTQYWARNPHVSNYNARYGILLDMVGGKDAVFKYEYYSQQYAKGVVKKVWKTGRQLGFGKFFSEEDGGGVTDDHLFVNTLAHIPCIDIIPSEEDGGFYKYWHTVKDDMEGIDRTTLKAVGQTLLEVIYNEY